MKAISYSLFGYERQKLDECFDFATYLRGVMLNLRLNRLIYPEWQTILQTDKATYTAFEGLLKPLDDAGILIVERNSDGAKMCEAMLWRLKPIYRPNITHLICRDLDAIATYRERQAVQYWVDSPGKKVMHAITDSISHDLPLLGGMIGFTPDNFIHRTGQKSFQDLMGTCKIDLSTKGSDQTFLNDSIYPYFGLKGTDSITQHYFNGHGDTFLSDWHTCGCAPPIGHAENCPNNYKIDLPDELKETNSLAGHIGVAGPYMPPTERFIHKYKDRFTDLTAIEKQYPKIFYWNE